MKALSIKNTEQIKLLETREMSDFGLTPRPDVIADPHTQPAGTKPLKDKNHETRQSLHNVKKEASMIYPITMAFAFFAFLVSVILIYADEFVMLMTLFRVSKILWIIAT
jgi:hypothetical protein